MITVPDQLKADVMRCPVGAPVASVMARVAIAPTAATLPHKGSIVRYQ